MFFLLVYTAALFLFGIHVCIRGLFIIEYH